MIKSTNIYLISGENHEPAYVTADTIEGAIRIYTSYIEDLGCSADIISIKKVNKESLAIHEGTEN
jgi:hypothetical protein